MQQQTHAAAVCAAAHAVTTHAARLTQHLLHTEQLLLLQQ
jgi:hypothetical protein